MDTSQAYPLSVSAYYNLNWDFVYNKENPGTNLSPRKRRSLCPQRSAQRRHWSLTLSFDWAV